MSVRTAALWALGSQYASFALQFVTSIVLARWFITPEQLGQFSIAFAAVTLVAFLQDFGVTRYVNGERDLTPDKLRSAFAISVLFAWGIALLALLAAWPIARFYGDLGLLAVTLVIAASYLLVPLAIVPQATCQRRMDYRSNSMIEVGSAVANALTAVTLAVMGHGALALAWGAFAQQGARLVVSQWRAGGMLPWPLRIGDARPILALGGTNTVQVLCNSLSARAPELVIGRMIDNAAVGLFARASGLALQLRLLIAGAVTGVFYPAFRRIRDSGEPLGPPYRRVLAAYTGVTWPAMAGIAVLAGPLIRLLYGERWIAAAPLLTWVALSQIGYVALPLYADLPVLMGRLKPLMRCMIAETLLSILLIAASAPYGLEWVALSRVAHAALWVAIYLPLMQRTLDLSFVAVAKVWLQSAVVTIAAVLPVLAGYAIGKGPAELGLAQATATVLCGIALWFAALRLTRHPLLPEIIEMAQALLPVLRRRSGLARS
ncbi:MAG: oligosaccharide flippase family protein [Novosphingobium sp.]